MIPASIINTLNRASATEVADLLSSGYKHVFHVKCPNGETFIKLRHSRNGSYITLKTTKEGCILRKNGKTVKTVTANLTTLKNQKHLHSIYYDFTVHQY